ncbi:aldehyde dehydrogenase family protein [Actinocorallia populi]|uniref:aldehyde dehydrogenase family protein n=1 Tax=Actinocorallia populi TaxID=2079200 RepID=UPI000D09567A|nr:aldehyde dehydrogenase family protein [Actinocorallia populi]
MSTATADSRFESLDPATGEVVAEHPIHDEAAVRQAVDRARAAARWWGGLEPRERRRRLLAFKSALVRGMDRLAEVVHRETGKTLADAQTEVVMAVGHLDWAARNAVKVLGPRTVRPGLMSINQKCVIEYQPLGVVGVIGPWNYPVYTPMGSITYALAAGNAIVFKPSEYTPGTGEELARIFAEAVPEHPVLQVVTGLGGTGAALCRSGVDKIAFTGSPPTAKRVMAACAETLTPVVIEGGGKDAFLVDADADLETAAQQAVYGAMANAGQTCVGVERVYVHERVYAPFVEKVVAKAARLRPGSGPDASFGPITMPGQLEIIERHIADALAKGARALVGGLDSVKAPYAGPVVLADPAPDSLAVREETFGPTLTIEKVKDLDEGVAKANDTPYGLAATVFTRSRRSLDLARRLNVGAVSVNSFAAFASIGALPFGGVGESGFGRIHGPDGLREFSRAKSITRERFKSPINLLSFERSPKDFARALALVRFLHS